MPPTSGDRAAAMRAEILGTLTAAELRAYIADRVARCQIPWMAEARCGACGTVMIPGITSCVSCGEPAERDAVIEFRISEIRPAPYDIERLMEENRRARERSRQMTESRALEYAGDLDAAIAMYEQMVKDKFPWPLPYKRLAIIYAKAKRPADEERVVRAALATIPSDGPNSWFVLRLAKIIGKKKRERGA